MGKKSAPPPPPDYTAAAERTAASSNEAANRTTWANRPTIETPWGSQTWETQAGIDPSTGQKITEWTQRTNLTPETQAALDQQQALQRQRSELAGSFMSRVGEEYAQPFNWGAIQPGGGRVEAGNLEAQPGVQAANLQAGYLDPYGRGIQSEFGGYGRMTRGVGGSQDYGNRAEEALYQRSASRMDPMWASKQKALETQLANQGITRGSTAWQNAMQGLGQQRNDAYQQAIMGSIIGGGQEAQRMQGMDIGAGQFMNTAQQQAYNQALQRAQFANQAAGQQFGQEATAGAQNFSQLQAATNQNFQQQLAAQNQMFAQQQAAGGQNFQQQLAASQYANQLRQQQIAEEMQRRGMSLNEMNALLTGQQVGMPSMPSFNPATAQQGVNYYGATKDQYGAAMDQFNAKQAQSSAAGSSIGSLVGGVGGAMIGGPMGASLGASLGGSIGGGLF